MSVFSRTRQLMLLLAAGLVLAAGMFATAHPVAAQTSANRAVIAQKPDDKKPGGTTNDVQNNKADNKDPVTGETVKKSSVVDYINSAYTYLAGIGGLLAVLMLVYAGYRYMTSYGDPEKISDAKDIVEKSLVGLALLILAAVILNTINPRTTDPCTPGQPGCGDIDFTKPDGGKPAPARK